MVVLVWVRATLVPLFSVRGSRHPRLTESRGTPIAFGSGFTENHECYPPSPGDHSNTITPSEAFYNEIDQDLALTLQRCARRITSRSSAGGTSCKQSLGYDCLNHVSAYIS
jgi:hypothetical protein